MDGYDADCVVNVQTFKNDGCADTDNPGPDGDEDRAFRRHDIGRSGNADQTSQDTVKGMTDIGPFQVIPA